MEREPGREVPEAGATPGAFIGWAVLAAACFGLAYGITQAALVGVLGVVLVVGLLLVGVIAKGVQVGRRD
jgi:hypothetical protein